MKSIFINLLVGLTSIGVMLLAVEGAMRLSQFGRRPSWNDRPRFYYNPVNSHTLQAQTHPLKKELGTYRIAVIGDSFCFAPFMQFDDAFPRRLERLLSLNSGEKKVEVVNYGVPGYSTIHEVDAVTRAIAEQADMILLEVTLNDPELKPYTPTGIVVKKNPNGAYVLDDNSPEFIRRSFLLSFIAARIHNYQSHHRYQDYFFSLYEKPREMRKFEGALGKIAKIAEESKVPIVSVVFPLFGTAINESYPFRPIHEKIHGALTSAGIPYLDLTNAFIGVPPERLQVLPGEDFHPNEIGHRIAAEEIFGWLVSSKKLPEEFGSFTMFSERDQIILKNSLHVPVPVSRMAPASAVQPSM